MALFDPYSEARYRAQKPFYLNYAQSYCKECKKMRSKGQFNLDQVLCDRCYLRKPKAA